MAAVLQPRGDRLPSFSLESERRKRRSTGHRVSSPRIPSPVHGSSASAPASPSLRGLDPPRERRSSDTSSSPPLFSYFSLPTFKSGLNSIAATANDNDGDGLQFPEYDRGDSSEDASSSDSPAPSPTKEQDSHYKLLSSGPANMPRIIGDDTSAVRQPTYRVDYLGYNWREGDLWASWRYVLSMKGAVEESERLENASWRSWAKLRGRLGTVSAESLHWDKDCDITWLYGPLLSHDGVEPYTPTPATPPLSSSSSFTDRKSILKKRTPSQTILQDSLSAHTLLKQASAIIEAQTRNDFSRRPRLARSSSDHVVSRIKKHGALRVWADSRARPTSEAPSRAGRHISFNTEVRQCIAVENTGEPRALFGYYSYDSSGVEDDTSSEDSFLMMGHIPSRPSLSNRSTPRSSFSSDTQIIAPLPSTTLKSRSDTPKPRTQEPTAPQNPYAAWSSYRASISRSSSTETLRPAPPKDQSPDHNFLLDDEDEEAEMQNSSMESCWGTTGSSWDTGEPASQVDSNWFRSSSSPKDGDEQSSSRDVFVPFGYGDESESDDGSATEDEVPAEHGLFGRVIDTVNTARDIAHVIWNFPAFSILNP